MGLRWLYAVLLALPGAWGEWDHGGRRGCVGMGVRGAGAVWGWERLRGVPPRTPIILPPPAGDCPKPPRFAFAEPREPLMESYAVGEKVRYRCRPGYAMVGGTSPVVTCEDGSRWSEKPDFCIGKSPPTPNRGLLGAGGGWGGGVACPLLRPAPGSAPPGGCVPGWWFLGG